MCTGTGIHETKTIENGTPAGIVGFELGLEKNNLLGRGIRNPPPIFHDPHRKLKGASLRTEAESEHFACKDSGLSQILKLMFSASEKILINVNVAV